MKWLDNLRGDIFGGLTTSVVALPLALAFGVAAFAPLGPQYLAKGALAGLYASIIAGALASIFGGTPAQISGPTAPMSVVVTSVIVKLLKDAELSAVPGDTVSIILLLLAVTVLVGGLFQVILSLTGGGRLIKYIPYPVISGFMNGIAVIIFLSQIRPLAGVDKSVPMALVFAGADAFRPETLAAGAVTALVTVLGDRFVKAVPGALLGLGAGTGTYFAFGFLLSPDLLHLTGNPLIIGPIPGAIPSPDQATAFFRLAGDIPMAKWRLVLAPGLTLGLLAAIDTLLTSVIADVVTKTRHNSTKELRGQGIGNLAAAAFGCLPVAGSTVVTMVNVNAGGRTPLSGLIKSASILVIILVLPKVVQWIPMSVLAGILMVTAVKMVDYESLHLLKKKSAFESLVIILTVTAVTVAVDIMAAVGVGLVISAFLFVKQNMAQSIFRRIYTADKVRSKKVRDMGEMRILEEHGDKIAVYELTGSLFFGTCDKLLAKVESDTSRICVVLDLKRVATIDLTGARILRQMADSLNDAGRHLLLCLAPASGIRDKERMERFLRDMGVLKVVGEKIFQDADHALEWAEDRLIRHHLPEETSEAGQTARLGDMPMFRDLTHGQLMRVRPYLHPASFCAGDIIIRQDDPGDGIYFIVSGMVSVRGEYEDDRAHVRLAVFSTGVFFGEMAILEEQPRSATVKAQTDASLLFMSRQGFERLTRTEPQIASCILLGMARELSYRLRAASNEVRALAE